MKENVEIDSLKKIEASEVAKHTTRDDLYIVIDKMVYNVSCFINEHPGGEEVLLDVAGALDLNVWFVFNSFYRPRCYGCF